MLAASEVDKAVAARVASTLAAEAIEASTWLSIAFWARATQFESGPRVVPAAPTASDAAPAFALITDASCALSVIASALIAAAPSIVAQTSVAILLTPLTPEPARPMPVVPAAPTAIEPANTSASTVATSLALSERLPPASTELFERYALTSAGARSPSAVQPIRLCASAAPMAAAAPVLPQAPQESDVGMNVASISERLVAVSVISPPLERLEPSA